MRISAIRHGFGPLFLFGLAIAPPALAQTLPRSEVPIREVVLSDGEHRYTIPITVGSTAIDAGLTPYFAFDILYDPDKGEIGVRPRPPGSGAPTGQLVAPN